MPRLLMIGAVLAVVASASVEAQAHEFEHPKAVQIGVRPSSLVVAVSYDVNPGNEARMLRALFDRDADGRLGADEEKLLSQYLERTAMLFFDMKIQSETAQMVRREATSDRTGLPVDANSSMGIRLLYTVDLPEPDTVRQLRIEISDRDKDGTKHVPLMLDVAPEWNVALASQGEFHPSTRQIARVRLNSKAGLTLEIRRSGATKASGL